MRWRVVGIGRVAVVASAEEGLSRRMHRRSDEEGVRCDQQRSGGSELFAAPTYLFSFRSYA